VSKNEKNNWNIKLSSETIFWVKNLYDND
jgi:hypothetical protein